MKFEEALAAMREGKKVRRDDEFIYYLDSDMVAWAKEIDNGKKHLAIFHSRDITSEDWKIVDEIKNYQPSGVVRLKDAPVEEMDITEWKRLSNTSKFCYNVGDDCVFEITRGNRKWTIPLDKFFDKIIEMIGEQN